MSELNRLNKFILFILVVSIFLPDLSLADQFKVIHVYDGDTIEVTLNDKHISIRLVGIDAPEISKKSHVPGQPFSTKAKEYLADLVLDNVVDIKFYGRDEYGRSLGEVFVDGLNINLGMIDAGLAEVYRGEPARGLEITIYRDAERKAKESVQGIWVLRDQYFSPWDWREIYW